MEYFAHIFIGKEFAEIISNIGKQVCKYGGENMLSSVNLFLVEDKNLRQFIYPEKSITVKDVVLQNDVLKGDWNEVGKLIGTAEKDKDLFVNEIFNKLLTVGNMGTHAALYVVFHFPLYKSDALKDVKSIYKTIIASERPVNINFMGYCDDLAPIIEPSFNIKNPAKEQIAEYVRFRDAENIAYSSHFIALQNSSQNGISLGLDKDSLSAVIGHFAMLCAEHYQDIFPNTVEYKDAVAIGLSTLYLDKYLYAEYLLNKTLLNAMDHVQLNDQGVNVNDAYTIAHNVFADKTVILSSLFQQIDKQQKHEEDKEFPEIQSKLTAEVQEIIERSKQILGEQKAITMQAAILAVCLAKTDCELFTNTIFSQDIVTLDKLFDEPLTYFIDSDRAQYYKLGEEQPINPIQQLKELDTLLVQSETEIRGLQEQIKTFESQITESEKASDCFIEDGIVHFGDQKFRLLPSVEQEPLKETYSAHEVIAKSLDLRSKFTAIKNQGAQGSCLSFTLTSIFEYVMQLNQAQEFDLSEAFLYYNARDLDGDGSVNEDLGSRFKPSIDSLVKYGIALEKVWPYNDQVYSQKPSEEAYNDAAMRKLVAAMNVQRKVADIKSALVDGCPVAASFTLTRSFFEQGGATGYVPMPSDEEIAAGLDSNNPDSRHGRHAMVIVGFSDELQMFIIRNSWGTDWGDNGYCYVPYTYIEHDYLFNYACIITEIENLQTKRLDIVPPMKIDTTDLNIKYTIARNALYVEEKIAEKLRKDKIVLRAYFEQVKQLFSNPNERDHFIEANKAQISLEQEELLEQVKQKNVEHEKNDEAFSTYKKEVVLRLGSFSLGVGLFAILYNLVYYQSWTWWWPEAFFGWILLLGGLVGTSYFFRQKSFVLSFWKAPIAMVGVFVLRLLIYLLSEKVKSHNTFEKWFEPHKTVWWLVIILVLMLGLLIWQSHKRWRKWRDERDRIDYDIEQLQREINAKERENNLFKLKTFSAWTLLNALQGFQNSFYAHYTNLISLINNLRNWYKAIEQREDTCVLDTPLPDTSLLSAEKLDVFFENYLKEDPDLHIDFCEDIDKYKITEESLKVYKDSLVEKVVTKLLARKELSDFNIASHIVDNTANDIAQEIDRKLVVTLDEKSGIFLNVSSSERGIIVPSTAIYTPSMNQYRDTLRKKLGKFSEPYFESEDKYRLTFLKTATVWFRECVNFK